MDPSAAPQDGRGLDPSASPQDDKRGWGCHPEWNEGSTRQRMDPSAALRMTGGCASGWHEGEVTKVVQDDMSDSFVILNEVKDL